MTEADLATAMMQVARSEMEAFCNAEMVDGFISKSNRKGGRRAGNSHVTLAKLKAIEAAGMSAAEAARHLDVNGSTIGYYQRKHGLEFRDGRKRG
jgi:transcriptional regulator with GAF, ATPase, and Fis domain